MRLALAALLAVLAMPQPAAVAAPPQGFAVHETPQEVPDLRFAGGDGRELGRRIGPSERGAPEIVAFRRGFAR